MAELCLDCFNQCIGGEKLTEKDVIMDIDLCEGCGEWKPCVIRIKEKNIFKRTISSVSIKCRRIISLFRKR